jgi:hypothetical protein
MNTFVHHVELAAPLFVLVLAGYLLMRICGWPKAMSENLSRFVFSVALPAMLFRLMSDLSQLPPVDARLLLAFFGGCLIVFVIGRLVAWRLFALDGVGQSVFALGGVFSNNVLLGLPLAKVALGDSVIAAAAGDGAQELAAQLRRVLEFAAERLGDHPLVAAPVFAEQQAQLLGFDDAGGTACLAVLHQRVGDVAGHPFLVGEAMADRVDQAGDAAKAVQASAGQVGDMRDAAKRHQVVRADAMHGNAAHDHQVAAQIGEAVAERGRRVEVVAAEQAALPEFADTLRGAPMCVASGAMPQAVSRSPTARSKAAGIEGCWRGCRSRLRAPAGSGWLQSDMACFLWHG